MLLRFWNSTFLLMTLLLLTTAANADEEGFVPLIEDASLDNWTGDAKQYFSLDGDVLTCRKGCRGNLLTKKEYSDFVLRFEFRLTPAANNGIGLRVPPGGRASYDGIEIQILDDTADKYRDLRPYQYHGSAYGIAPARKGFLNPVGEWNEQEIQCIGRQITVILNGVKILDIDLDEVAPGGETMDGEDHPGLDQESGHVGLLCHNDEVSFRNIRIKEIDPTESSE